MYIQAPLTTKPITITKGKVPRIKRAKWHEVPEAYRKKKIKINTHFVSDILLYVIGLIEFIRKGVKK